MIFGNIKHEKTYSKIEDDLKVCFEYAKKNALSEFDKGSYQLDGDNIFVNIVEYETCGKEQRFWEAHKKYIDIHLIIIIFINSYSCIICKLKHYQFINQMCRLMKDAC